MNASQVSANGLLEQMAELISHHEWFGQTFHWAISIREEFASALDLVISQKGVSWLIQALNNEERTIRAAAAALLGLVPKQAEQAVDALYGNLWDEDSKVRRSAAVTLGKIGPNAYHVLRFNKLAIGE